MNRSTRFPTRSIPVIRMLGPTVAAPHAARCNKRFDARVRVCEIRSHGYGLAEFRTPTHPSIHQRLPPRDHRSGKPLRIRAFHEAKLDVSRAAARCARATEGHPCPQSRRQYNENPPHARAFRLTPQTFLQALIPCVTDGTRSIGSDSPRILSGSGQGDAHSPVERCHLCNTALASSVATDAEASAASSSSITSTPVRPCRSTSSASRTAEPERLD
ncbi:MAG: hypothetical protein RL136_1841 [Planctomycetota bacterium]